MRLAGIDTIEAANRFFRNTFSSGWEQRFYGGTTSSRNAHRRLGREQRLEEILSVRAARQVADDHTVSWMETAGGCPGKKSARGFVERKWKSNGAGWLALACVSAAAICTCATAGRGAIGKSFRPTACRTCQRTEQSRPTRIKPKYHVPAHHPWRKPWKRTFLSGHKRDISTFALTRICHRAGPWRNQSRELTAQFPINAETGQVKY